MSETLRDLTARVALDVDTSKLDHLDHKLEGIHSALELLAGVEIIKGLFELGEKFSHVGEELETAAASAGITTEAFQRLSFAASQSGVGQEQLSGSLARLGRTLANAREGSEGAVETFGKIGITPEQLAGFGNATEAFKAVSNSIAAIEDPVQRTQATMELFGRGGSKMIRFLSKGSENMTEEMARAGDMGAVITNQQVEQLANLEDSLTAFGQIVKSTFATIASYAAPIIKDFIEELGRFWAANRKILEVNLKKWFYDFGFALGYIYGAVTDVIQLLFKFAERFPNLTFRIAEVVTALAGFSAILWAGGKALGVVSGIFRVFNGVLTAANIGFSGASIAGRALWGVLGLMQVGVGNLIVSLGTLLLRIPLIGTVLGGAVRAIGFAIATSPLGLLLAGITAVVVASHDLWTLWKGGSWEDTWLGKGIIAIMGAAKVVGKWLGLSSEKSTVTEITDPAEITRMKLAAMGQPLSPEAQANIAQLGGAMRPVRGTVPELVAPTLNDAGTALAAAGQVSIQNTYNIQAPVGSDEAKLAQIIKAQTDRDRESMLRQAKDVLIKPRMS